MNHSFMDWMYNHKTIQSLFLNVCGYCCIYFILFRCRGIPMRSIAIVFISNLPENDRRMSQLICDLTQR